MAFGKGNLEASSIIPSIRSVNHYISDFTEGYLHFI